MVSIEVDGNNPHVLPTLWESIDPSHLDPYLEIFSKGRQRELTPVVFLEDEEGMLTIDGNHRLLLTLLYPGLIPGVIYGPGEKIIGTNYRLSQNVIDGTRLSRKLAIQAGILTFSDLCKRTFS